MTINIKNLFENAGLEEIRPTDQALKTMGISRRRFSQLIDNKYVTPIQVKELEAIKAWIEEIKSIDPNQIIGELDDSDKLARELGMSKT